MIVEPESSSRAALPSRAAVGEARDFGGALPQVQRFGVAHHRHHQPLAVCVAMPEVHGRVAVHDAGVVVEARVDLRELAQSAAPPPA